MTNAVGRTFDSSEYDLFAEAIERDFEERTIIGVAPPSQLFEIDDPAVVVEFIDACEAIDQAKVLRLELKVLRRCVERFLFLYNGSPLVGELLEAEDNLRSLIEDVE